MKMAQFISITLVIILGMFLNTCGQMISNDEGMGSKTIEEASGTTSEVGYAVLHNSLYWQSSYSENSSDHNDPDTYCSNLSLSSRTNWRIPTSSELVSLCQNTNSEILINDLFQHSNLYGGSRHCVCMQAGSQCSSGNTCVAPGWFCAGSGWPVKCVSTP